MALDLEYPTPAGIPARYWRIFDINAAKTGAGGPVGIVAQIGLYHSAEAINDGRGALLTRQLTMPVIGVAAVEDLITDADAEAALGVLLAWIYGKAKAGEYELAEGETNIFGEAVDV